jgi:hypothetical protein
MRDYYSGEEEKNSGHDDEHEHDGEHDDDEEDEDGEALGSGVGGGVVSGGVGNGVWSEHGFAASFLKAVLLSDGSGKTSVPQEDEEGEEKKKEEVEAEEEVAGGRRSETWLSGAAALRWVVAGSEEAFVGQALALGKDSKLNRQVRRSLLQGVALWAKGEIPEEDDEEVRPSAANGLVDFLGRAALANRRADALSSNAK